jgi:hypothetical protein
MSNLNVENTSYEFPNLLRHNALEKEMINALIFRTENTTNRFIQISFKQVIPSHKFVVRKEPQKNVNPGRYYQFPNSRNVNWHHTPKINDSIQRTRRIDPRRFILPDQGVTLS